MPFIFQEAKESIDEEDPRPTSSNGAYIMWYQEHLHLGVEEKSPEFQEPRDLRSNPVQWGGNDAILPRKGIG